MDDQGSDTNPGCSVKRKKLNCIAMNNTKVLKFWYVITLFEISNNDITCDSESELSLAPGGGSNNQ
jgi:hypothetical protein